MKLRISKDLDVQGLCFDSRAMRPGFLFFAINGKSSDGHSHLESVLQKNPAGLIVENRARVPASCTVPVIVVDNARVALDQAAAEFYGYPGSSLFCVGVTGTNGKTTSVYMLEQIFNLANRPTAVLGTIDHHLGPKKWETDLTTPDPVTLQMRLRECLDLGAKVAAFEVSSIALDQDRASSIPLDAAIFTNFSRDHLDYHGTMENYFAAKQKLFSELLVKSPKKNAFGVVNADDTQLRSLKTRARLIRFGMEQCEYRFEVKEKNLTGSKFIVHSRFGLHDFFCATPGVHNVYNAVGVTALAMESGVSAEVIRKAFQSFHGAPGRLESVPNTKGLHVFVDYAHTDDALRSVLQALRSIMRESKSTGKLWTIFGCGGDRDKGKRPLMTKAAIENSDQVILTSDNPRTEDPLEIINDCLKGNLRDRIRVEVDRKTSIHSTLQSAREGDVILIAGKGHENYQIIGQTKHPFDDVTVAREFLK